jgi:CRISPR-associated Csx2 family protein
MNQPKPRVLVSFIGKGQSGGSSSGYRTTQYTFPDGWQSPELSVFGIALLTYYEAHLRRSIDKWLVLGSPQSNWDALLEAVPDQLRDDALSRRHETVRTTVKAEEDSSSASGIGQLTQPLLDAWSDALSERLHPMAVKCQLVGWCEAHESQLQMWRVLSQEVPEGSELVLDITHGFRHQPMLLAPMVVLLGMLKNLSGVELYYGALDMDRRVLKLDLFPELLRYIQHLSLLQTSGDYEPLGKALIEASLCDQLAQIAFVERTNRPISPNRVHKLLAQAQRMLPSDHPLKCDLFNSMRTHMQKHLQPSHWERLCARADEAAEHKDYVVAYTLLYEATVAFAVHQKYPNPQEAILDPSCRAHAFGELCHRDTTGVLKTLRNVRNTIVHASQPPDGATQQALQSEAELQAFYRKASQTVRGLVGEQSESSRP